MHSRRLIVLCIFLGIAIAGWLIRRNSLLRREQPERPVLSIDKQPVTFANHTFDPASPPPAMPTLAYGEEAVCDSNFSSNTSVGGTSEKTDAARATVTISKVTMILRLGIDIWVPSNATQHVAEHEDGHRQISEYFYRSADKLAGRIASAYIGQQITINGADLNSQFDKALHQTATNITAEYDKSLGSAAAQQYYDMITDHGRNEVGVKDAVAAAIQNTTAVSLLPSPAPTIFGDLRMPNDRTGSN